MREGRQQKEESVVARMGRGERVDKEEGNGR